MATRTRGYGYFLAAADIALTLLALYLADLIRHTVPIGFGGVQNLDWLTAREYLIVAVVWAFFLRFAKVYDHRRVLHVVGESRALVAGVLIATGALFAAFFILKVEFLSRMLFVYFVLIDLALLVNVRWLLKLAVRRSRLTATNLRRVLIVGAGPVGDRLSQMIIERPWSGYRVVGFVDDRPDLEGGEINGRSVLGTCDDLPDVIARRKVDEVLVALPMRAHGRIRQIVQDLEEMHVRIRLVPDVFSMVRGRAAAEDMWGIPLISVRAPVITGFDRVVKRVFDLALATLTLIVMAPVMAVVAVAVYLETGLPVIFAQQRVGENGRLFTIYKFRTMRPSADRAGDGANHKESGTGDGYKPSRDPRVTRLGRFLRRTSLDELPQLLNVLKGEMSLVGPRPELPWVVAKYESWQRQRLSVLPGMTGWWQVNGRGQLPLRDNVEYDLHYIQNYSPLLDVAILLRTLWVVVRGQGAY